MTEILEGVAVHIDSSNDENCPFCPAEEINHDWKTYGGEKNSSSMLRKYMKDPKKIFSQETKVRPKENGYPDSNPSPKNTRRAYSNAEHGEYGYEAHHSISGKEILSGEPLENIISNASKEYKGQIGYSINNAANGVFLPSYPRKYRGKWSAMEDEKKYKIMSLAMAAGEGQAHIGSHGGHEHSPGQDYPSVIKENLAAIKDRILSKREGCPFCEDADGDSNKFVPPYKVNIWLDLLSKNIERKLTSSVNSWPYFISGYAKQYYLDVTASNVDPEDDFY